MASDAPRTEHVLDVEVAFLGEYGAGCVGGSARVVHDDYLIATILS